MRFPSYAFSPFVVEDFEAFPRLVQWRFLKRALRQIRTWPVHISCPWRNSKVEIGHIRHAYPWAADGAATALLLGMKTKFQSGMFSKASAISDMPQVAHGLRPSVLATPCVFRFWRHQPAGVKNFFLMCPRAFFISLMSMSETIFRWSMVSCNLIYRAACGSDSIAMCASNGWQSVFWRRT